MFRLPGYMIGAALLSAAVAFSPTAHAAFKVLYTFKCGTDGCNPHAPLIIDGAGNLYGTTYEGGLHSDGAVFKLAPDGTESVLYSFRSGADGAYPGAGVTMDNSGNLYGTTSGGGTGCSGYGCGTVYKLAPDGTETVLHAFTDKPDGATPYAGVVIDGKGNLFGTTFKGGAGTSCNVTCGTVYEIAADGTETVLYRFQGGSDGGSPYAGLILDAHGNLYGTTAFSGGGNGCYSGCGTVFEVTPDGTESVLHAFNHADGADPYAGLIMDKSGNLYGTTAGGAPTRGAVFSLAPDGTETILHIFHRAKGDGIQPEAGLIQDANGNLYGTTSGSSWHRGGGTVFEITK